MTIDAKELREAIERVRTLPTWNVSVAYWEHIETVISAAEAHLATLPREVEVETWVLVDGDGEMISAGFKSEDEARRCNSTGTLYPARLTGKALLPGSKE